MNIFRTSGGRTAAVVGAVALTVSTLAISSPATAAAPVSQASGRLVSTTLLSTTVLDALASLKGATAVNPTGAGDVIVDTPLDAAAVGGLVMLKSSTTNLPVFGSAGVIRLGAVGQYGRANADGSSVAFSGAVSAAPGLVGAGTGVTAGPDVGTPSAGTVEVAVGDGSLFGTADAVTVDLTVGSLAAAAREDTSGAQTGTYRLSDLSIVVGGTLVSTPIATLRPAIDTLVTALNTAGVTGITNPFTAAGTITLTTADLQNAGLGSDLSNLPSDTDLMQFVPRAVIAKITSLANGVLLNASTASGGVSGLPGVVLNGVINIVRSTVDPVIAGLDAALLSSLNAAITPLVQVVANHQNLAGGAFTETALRVGLGESGRLASVDLASAAVGPNAAPPTGGTTTAGTTTAGTTTTGATTAGTTTTGTTTAGTTTAGATTTAGTTTTTGTTTASTTPGTTTPGTTTVGSTTASGDSAGGFSTGGTSVTSGGVGTASLGSLAHTGLSAVSELLPWGILAALLITGGATGIVLRRRRHRAVLATPPGKTPGAGTEESADLPSD